MFLFDHDHPEKTFGFGGKIDGKRVKYINNK